MHITVVSNVRGRKSVNASRDTGGGVAGRMSFCRLIRADGKRCRWPGASSNPSPKGLGNVFDVSKERPIAFDGADGNADLVTEV
jgi:hypothetical protein